ncbi:hypothetical protein ACEWY4_026155 [Coilia grayii]|uniref:SUN domain-containing protein n=1 Tax=Coilia grayii TaxID=363190 RepID=A0ABD1IU19_9TELE
MSRRSMRLLTSGYYRADGEIYDSSSSHEVSYRETPVSSLSTSGYSSSSSEECEAGLDPTWRKRSRLLSRSQSQGTMLFAGLFLLCCSLFGLLRDVLLLSRYGSSHTPTAAQSEPPGNSYPALEEACTDCSDFDPFGYCNDPDWQTKMTEDVTVMAKNVAELKNSVSHLSNDHRNLNQRMEAQEDTNAQLKKELTDWITEELQRRVGMDTGSILLRPELQGALEALERRLLQRLSELEDKQHGDVWKIVGESLQKEGLGAITIKDVHEIVQRALSLYKTDGTGMADYALESLGASVIESQSSETYSTRSTCTSLFGIPLWYISGSPRTVIQPEVHPGKCWAFRGSQGFVTVALSHPVRVTHVTLEHIPKSLSPTGRIDSAPREFAVYGLSGSGEQEEGHILGRFTYDSDGEPIQTFQLPDSVKDVYRAVQLRVLSNWGHPEYSCVYRFRVHGQPLPH